MVTDKQQCDNRPKSWRVRHINLHPGVRCVGIHGKTGVHRKYEHNRESLIAEFFFCCSRLKRSSIEILHCIRCCFVLFRSVSVQTHTCGSRGPFSRVPHSCCTLLTSERGKFCPAWSKKTRTTTTSLTRGRGFLVIYLLIGEYISASTATGWILPHRPGGVGLVDEVDHL